MSDDQVPADGSSEPTAGLTDRKPRWPRPLTARQREILSYIEQYIGEHNFPPSIRELSDACRLGSSSGAHRVLAALERKGYILKTGKHRAFTVVLPPSDYALMSPPDQMLVAATFLVNAALRDRTLAMASRVSSMEVKSVLIRDAFERQDVLVELARRLVGVDEALPQGTERLKVLLRALRVDVDWPTFVVDHLILNRGAAAVARLFAVEAPFVQGLYARLSRLCERAARDAEVWLSEMLEATPHPTHKALLRRRATAMVGMGLKTARLIQGERRELFSSLVAEFENLPEAIRPRAKPRPG